MKRMKIVALVFVLVLMLVSVMPVGAVTDGTPDGDGHPYVGIITFHEEAGWYRCSGTLLSPTVFLTAGHCTADVIEGTKVQLWFETDLTDFRANYEPTGEGDAWYMHGDYTGTAYAPADYQFPIVDVGVVVLDSPVEGITEFGALPQADELNQLKTRRGHNDTYFTAVGYGLQESFPDPAYWKTSNQYIRMVAYPKLLQINVPGFTGWFSMLLSNNANTGGTCFGDSGGPNFLRDTNVIAGVTSYGINGNCAGTGGVYRMDQQSALDFVNGFLTP